MNLSYKIIKDSIKVLILTSILSSIGGMALKTIEEKLIVLLPFVIALPALNDLIGDFGIIITSKFTTFLYEGKMKGKLKKSKFIRHLFKNTFLIALFSAFYLSFVILIISYLKKFSMDQTFIIKFIVVMTLSILILYITIFLISIIGSYYVYKKNKDPDLVLIPLTTAIADLGAMIILAVLIFFIF